VGIDHLGWSFFFPVIVEGEGLGTAALVVGENTNNGGGKMKRA
jgi:hypothetical protein